MKNLLYTLLNYNTTDYVKMYRIFLKSLVTFSDCTKFDLLIITDAASHKILVDRKKVPELTMFHETPVHFHIVESSPDLSHALLRKFDIADVHGVEKYAKVLYLDCDIIVQKDLNKLFDSVPVKANVLYAPSEGVVDGKYWKLEGAMKNANVEKMKKDGVKSFNSGTFMFKPTKTMLKHFVKAREFAISYKESHFYDQSFFNYYFNMNRLSCTDYISDQVVVFPDSSKYYPRKVILHFAGIGRYKEKAMIMKKYFDFIIEKKKL